MALVNELPYKGVSVSAAIGNLEVLVVAGYDLLRCLDQVRGTVSSNWQISSTVLASIRK